MFAQTEIYRRKFFSFVASSETHIHKRAYILVFFFYFEMNKIEKKYKMIHVCM